MASGDKHALTALYIETYQYLSIQFRRQGDTWLQLLLEEFKAETLAVIRAVESLSDWKPREGLLEVDLVQDIPKGN